MCFVHPLSCWRWHCRSSWRAPQCSWLQGQSRTMQTCNLRPRKGPVNEAWTIKSKVSIYFFSPCCLWHKNALLDGQESFNRQPLYHPYRFSKPLQTWFGTLLQPLVISQIFLMPCWFVARGSEPLSQLVSPGIRGPTAVPAPPSRRCRRLLRKR
jgi:hypothetical protein